MFLCSRQFLGPEATLEGSRMPKPLFISLLIVLPIAAGSMAQNVGLAFWALILVLVANPNIRRFRKNRYFASEGFQALKAEVGSVVAEHNDVVNYVAEMRGSGAFELGPRVAGSMRTSHRSKTRRLGTTGATEMWRSTRRTCITRRFRLSVTRVPIPLSTL